MIAAVLIALVVGALLGATVMSWCVAAGDADRHADVDALAKQARETRTERVWANVPSSGDEHEIHLGIG